MLLTLVLPILSVLCTVTVLPTSFMLAHKYATDQQITDQQIIENLQDYFYSGDGVSCDV